MGRSFINLLLDGVFEHPIETRHVKDAGGAAEVEVEVGLLQEIYLNSVQAILRCY